MTRQSYVSRELMHFVGRHEEEEERFQLLVQILRSGWLLHEPFNPARSSRIQIHTEARTLEDIISPEMTCFADIPIDDLSLHMEKYSSFGISFSKEFLVRLGANPVFYIVKNGSVVESIKREKVIQDGEELQSPSYQEKETRDQFFHHKIIEYFYTMERLKKKVGNDDQLTHLLQEMDDFLVKNIFAFLKPFDASKADGDKNNYYMEREWRLVGNVKFSLSDVRRVLLPEKYAKDFRKELPDFYGQISFT
ncbi:abortive infection system antitoxin AbiGi family protein [Radiobacillus kanasensis]|uniref:abortive infection system antitoxin AbiGi family protein n=1 Tax=Radiobacillus kanasensis TaxID=2844358 RepID=UPI001E2F679C|nr:abortive infection system antitoxin AbiGi family protein [Radiobacillus kanasensis]UFU01111.1 abortive infection system antitoxin AbiGi family protein [Radiobacillus kanasensis]